MQTVCWLLPSLVACIVACTASGQGAPGGAVKGGWTTQFHDSENRLRSILSGDTATPIEGFYVIRLQGLNIKTLRTNGEVELTATAPECIYDVKRKVAWSAGAFSAATEDQRLTLSGLGFEFHQEDSRLAVSNQVHTTLRRQTNSPGQAPEKPIEVFADRLDFNTASNRAVYRGNVRADDAQMELTSGVLTVRPGAEGGSFETIEAEESVVVKGKTDGSRTTADRAIYDRSKEQVDLFGNPVWEQGGRRATADVMAFHRRDRSVEALGKVQLKIPRDALGPGGFLPTTGAPARAPDGVTNVVAGATNAAGVPPQWVDVFADHFLSRSNVNVASGAVRVVDGTNQLNGGVLTLTMPTKDTPESTVLVEQNVVVTQGARSVTADRMHYTKSSDTAVFNGKPVWKLEQSEGSADTLTLQPRSNIVEAAGHALVRLMRTGGAGSLLPALPARPGATNREATPIEIAADTFSVKDRRALFAGNVQAQEAGTNGADSRLRCAELEVRFQANTNRAEGAVARGGVLMEQGKTGITNGPDAYQRLEAKTVTARMDAATGAIQELVAEQDVRIWLADAFAAGERMNYEVPNDALRLEGDPFFINNVVMVYEAQSLTVDRRSGTYSAESPKTILFRPAQSQVPSLPPEPNPK